MASDFENDNIFRTKRALDCLKLACAATHNYQVHVYWLFDTRVTAFRLVPEYCQAVQVEVSLVWIGLPGLFFKPGCQCVWNTKAICLLHGRLLLFIECLGWKRLTNFQYGLQMGDLKNVA